FSIVTIAIRDVRDLSSRLTRAGLRNAARHDSLRDTLRDDRVEHFPQRRHRDGHDSGCDVVLHEIGRLAGEKDLRLMARVDRADRKVEGQPGAGRIVTASSAHVQNRCHSSPPGDLSVLLAGGCTLTAPSAICRDWRARPVAGGALSGPPHWTA